MSMFCRTVRGGLNAGFSSEEKCILILGFRGEKDFRDRDKKNVEAS